MPDDILGRALADLAEHPDSSAREIAVRLGIADDRRVFKALDTAAYDGACQRSRYGNGPWRWEASCGAVYVDPRPGDRPAQAPCGKRAGHENGPETDWKRDYHTVVTASPAPDDEQPS